MEDSTATDIGYGEPTTGEYSVEDGGYKTFGTIGQGDSTEGVKDEGTEECVNRWLFVTVTALEPMPEPIPDTNSTTDSNTTTESNSTIDSNTTIDTNTTQMLFSPRRLASTGELTLQLGSYDFSAAMTLAAYGAAAASLNYFMF